LIKLAFIRKLPNGNYRVFSEKGKNMGTYKSLSGAKNRLRQIEFFKHQANFFTNLIKQAKEHDVTFTYSGLLRFLRKEKPELVVEFMQKFLQAFNEACQFEDDVESIENICLLQVCKELDLNG
jgi:ferritin